MNTKDVIFGAVEAAVPSPATTLVKVDPQHLPASRRTWTLDLPTQDEVVGEFLPGVVAGAIGAFLWRKHPVLGGLAGYAVGANAREAWTGTGSTKMRAIGEVAVTAAGVAGSLAMQRRRPHHPIWGYLGGSVAAGLGVSLLINQGA